MPLRLFLGNVHENGERGDMSIGNEKFVIYCRRCHYGLCQHIEIGSGEKFGAPWNVILVDPCPQCEEARLKGVEVEVLDYPPKYHEIIRDPRNAVQIG